MNFGEAMRNGEAIFGNYVTATLLHDPKITYESSTVNSPLDFHFKRRLKAKLYYYRLAAIVTYRRSPPSQSLRELILPAANLGFGLLP